MTDLWQHKDDGSISTMVTGDILAGADLNKFQDDVIAKCRQQLEEGLKKATQGHKRRVRVSLLMSLSIVEEP